MRAAIVAAVLVLAAAPTAVAHAQEENLLAAAEDAYLNVDFEQTYALAARAVEQGRQSARHLARLYELMGLAAAAQGQEEDSRDAYIKMLALRPDAEVDRNLAPRLRSPFMEARGFWASRSERLGADVRVDRPHGGIRVQVTDPLSMARAIVVNARVGQTGAFTSVRREAEGSVLVPVEGMTDEATVEYYVQILDEHENRIVEEGSEADPRVSQVGGPSTGPGTEEPHGDSIVRKPWFWAIVGAVVIGGGLTAFFLLRDDSVTFRPALTFQ